MTEDYERTPDTTEYVDIYARIHLYMEPLDDQADHLDSVPKTMQRALFRSNTTPEDSPTTPPGRTLDSPNILPGPTPTNQSTNHPTEKPTNQATQARRNARSD